MLCRDLVEFESDEHKQCVMHKARATKLEPLVEVLSARAYPSLYWSLRMEIANAYREIMLVKEDHKRPHSKVRHCQSVCSSIPGPLAGATWVGHSKARMVGRSMRLLMSMSHVASPICSSNAVLESLVTCIQKGGPSRCLQRTSCQC